MRREPSVTRSLMLSLTGALIGFWLIAIVIGLQVIQHELDEIFDGALQQTSQRLLALIEADLQLRGADPLKADVEPDMSPKHEYLLYQLRTPDGAVALKSRDAPEAAFDAPLKVGFHNARRYRIYTTANADGTVFLQLADRFKDRREALHESVLAMLLPLLVLAPGSFVAIWFIVGRALRPIGALRDAIATKDGSDLRPIESSDDLPRELKPIVRSVNLLLQRLRTALETEREFTANSAHELRTPIAGALAQAQMLVQELPEGGAARGRAARLAGALSDLGRLSEKLLQLSRADAGIGAREDQIDLLGVLDLLVQEFGRNRDTAGRILYEDASAAPLMRAVDADAFAIVLRNVIENAVIHRTPGTPIAIHVDEAGVIRVANESAVAPAAELEELKKRFHRGKTAAAGSGLGLAIADRILQQMGGKLELASPARGKTSGFEVTITL